jgi:hypothetical protein
MPPAATAHAAPSPARLVLSGVPPRPAQEARRGRRPRRTRSLRNRCSPPVREQLAGRRDHRCDEDEEVDGHAGAHERCREPAERVAHDHDVTAAGDRLDDGVGVLLPAGRFVLAREVGRNRIVAELAQCGDDQMPVPTAPPPPWMSANVATAATLAEVRAVTLGVDGRRHWKPAQQRAGIEPPRGLSDLRHTYAAFAPRAGVPVFAVSRFMARASR